jgi:hypothetical protein
VRATAFLPAAHCNLGQLFKSEAHKGAQFALVVAGYLLRRHQRFEAGIQKAKVEAEEGIVQMAASRLGDALLRRCQHRRQAALDQVQLLQLAQLKRQAG